MTINNLPNSWSGLTRFVSTTLATAPTEVPTLRKPNPDGWDTPLATGGWAATTTLPEPPRSTATRRTAIKTIESALASTRGLSRGDGPEGREALVTKRESARLTQLLAQAPTRSLQRIARAVSNLERRPTSVATGVFLRSVAARIGMVGQSEQAHTVLAQFAERLDGMSDDAIKTKSTCLDLDSTRNTSDLNTSLLSYRRGTTRANHLGDTHADNDGLFQRFTGSCGPTALQMWLAESDPILAFALHDAGLTSDSTNDTAALFQKVVLETYGGIALGRAETLMRARMRNGLGRLVSRGVIGERSKDALLRFTLEDGALNRNARAALRELRAAYQGFPTTDELRRLRANNIPEKDDGMSNEGFMYVLNHFAGKMTGTTYVQTSPDWGFTRGGARRHFDTVARALRKGYDVPFGIAEPGHYMLLTGVKGRKPSRSFLVSDPEGGRTRWVSEQRFASGEFIDEEFALSWKNQRGYVDSFFLPRAAL